MIPGIGPTAPRFPLTKTRRPRTAGFSFFVHPARIASFVLVGTCALWAFSFPLLKALQVLGQRSAPAADSFFISTLLVAVRFSIAAVFFLAAIGFRRWLARHRAKSNPTPAPAHAKRTSPWFTREELLQGGGIGLFGGLGLVLQMDGLAYTSGSVSAFLTQGYAILIPLWTAAVQRRLPRFRVMSACGLVVIGAAVLSGLTWSQRQLGRGEWETLGGSVLFAAQILWLERPRFRDNRTWQSTTLMFTTMSLVCWVLALQLKPAAVGLFAAFATKEAAALLALLTVLCTLLTFPLANHWQPKVSATQAGLLYCTEPVFTSLVCLFVPSWISQGTGIDYPNEVLSRNLIVGGTLILLANLVLQMPVRQEGTGERTPSQPRLPRENT